MSNKVNTARRTLRLLTVLALAAASFSGFQPALAAKPALRRRRPGRAMRAVADLVTAAPAIAVVGVKKNDSGAAGERAGPGAGAQRFLVEADTVGLIRSNDVLAREASFLIDPAGQPKGKPPVWKGRIFLAFGRVENRVDFFSCSPASPSFPGRARTRRSSAASAADLAAADAPPFDPGRRFGLPCGRRRRGRRRDADFPRHRRRHARFPSRSSASRTRSPCSACRWARSSTKRGPARARHRALVSSGLLLPEKVPAKALAGQEAPDAAAASRDYADFLKALAPCDRGAATRRMTKRA